MGSSDNRSQQFSNSDPNGTASGSKCWRWIIMNNSLNPRQRNFVVGLIIIGLMIIGFFGLRTARAFRQFHGHRPPPPFSTESIETDVSLIRDWMTVPFISRMYHVPPPVL